MNNAILLATPKGVQIAFKFENQLLKAEKVEANLMKPMSFDVPIIEGTAVVPIKGVIMRNPPQFAQYFGITSLSAIQKAIQTAANTRTVSRIALDIDSPGGNVSGIDSAVLALQDAAKQVRVEAFVTECCASAAYWLASQANAIYASDKYDDVGSIGAKATLLDFSKAFEDKGIKVITVTSGKLKAQGEPGTEISEEYVARVQERVDAVFADFKKAVMSGRHMTEKDFSAVADADIFSAEEAIPLRLIDGYKTLESSIEESVSERKKFRAEAAHRRLQMA